MLAKYSLNLLKNTLALQIPQVSGRQVHTFGKGIDDRSAREIVAELLADATPAITTLLKSWDKAGRTGPNP